MNMVKFSGGVCQQGGILVLCLYRLKITTPWQYSKCKITFVYNTQCGESLGSKENIVSHHARTKLVFNTC